MKLTSIFIKKYLARSATT
jgi:ribose-phosphate pyrophosphokinase